MAIDIILLLFLAYGFYRGFSQGLVMAALGLVGYVVAVVVTFYFSHHFTVWLNWQSKWAPVVSYLILFIGIVLLFRLAAKLIEGLLSAMQINFVNKILGGVVGALVAVFIYSAGLWLLHQINIVTDVQLKESKTSGVLLQIAPTLFKIVSFVFPFLKNALQDFQVYLQALSTK